MISIDDRENPRDNPSLDLQPLIESLGVKTKLDHLPYGDYCFVGNGPAGPGMAFVGVERKRIKDLLSSMRTGRLHGHQLPGMTGHYDFCYLIVEGIVRRNPENGLLEMGVSGSWREVTVGSSRFMADTLEHFLCTTELTQVTVRRTSGARESAEQLVSLYHYWNNKLWSEHKSLKVIYTPPNPVVACGELPLVRRWAKELHGVGYEKSMAVADRFGSGRVLACAPVQEWVKIPGIGMGIAERAVKEICGEDT
jgi:ERCC4-type nuclease